MKTLLYTLSILYCITSCKAQSPIISLYDGQKVPRIENAYYKDVDNDFNVFIGTWTYTNGNEEFTVTLRKKNLDIINRISGITYYTDYLYGEFKYKDTNGNVLVNTLNNIDNTNIDVSEHQIFGNTIIPYKFLPRCEDCTPNERRVSLSFEDPGRAYLGYDIILRAIPNTTNNNNTDMELVLKGAYAPDPPEGTTIETRIPYGTYRLIKQ